MIRRAATSFDLVDGSPARVLCVHALDDHDLPVCRGVKREDLTDVDRPWAEWPSRLRCGPCEQIAPPGRTVR